MNQAAATNLITQTFNSTFDEQSFRTFVANLLNQVDRNKSFGYRSGTMIPKAFRKHISTYHRPFVYYDPDGERLDVLVVRLCKQSGLDRARTMQRNFAAWYLTQGHDEIPEAALIAFYHKDVSDWRFSFVQLEYVFGEEGVEEKLTPARRYSYLVGPTEPTHTAESQLHHFLIEDVNNPTISALAAAFQIETVSKQFFEEYKELFLKLVEGIEAILKKDILLAADFKRTEIHVPNFAKKLLGQIVFLYFVQKKGWLGVTPGEPWGSGSKDFLRQLFAKAEGMQYGNFFNDVLEPLFYEALAMQRPDDLFTIGDFTCQIPFLNGGLFEPMGGYDWQHTNLLLPNTLFSNRRSANDDQATGILDVFDRYNFTVWEEEPLEKEVAVDPEMLGKVFENLLEVQDRKSKGAFYTPREIVHYMCQESLINYLDTSVNGETIVVPREDVAVLVRQGALALQQDAAKEAGLKSGEYVLPQSVRDQAQELDDALAKIKLCDPAIGSGAFPVGMLHEIVQARLAVGTYLDDRNWKPYQLKRWAIQESIYGVDIDAGAVEIAKLRLWLSLVVDEENYDDIQPLPNLAYKIVCGNSLLGVEKNLLNFHLFKQLDTLKQRYFEETHRQEKLKLKAQIDQLIELLTGDKNTFDFEVYFHEVFAERDGFDVVIGNPPYLRIQGLRKKHPELANQYKKLYESATGSFDLYVLFAEKGLGILGNQGQLNFIMPDKWTNANFGSGLRNIIANGKHGKKLMSFGAYQIFNASTYTSLLWLTKKPNKFLYYFPFSQDYLTGKELERALYNVGIDDLNPIPMQTLLNDIWVLTDRITGSILDRISRQRRYLSAIFQKIFQGIATSKDSVYFLYDCYQNGSFIEGYSKELGKRVTLEADLMKPLLKGNQVHRYISLESNSFVLFPYRLYKQNDKDLAKIMSSAYIQKHFPHGWQYLQACEKAIKGRERGRLAKDTDWYRYIYPKNLTLFQQEKLMCPDISMGGNFTYDADGEFYMTTTVYGYIKHPHVAESYDFWLGLMNSKLLWFFLQNTGTVLANGYFRYKPAYLENFPVPEPNSEQEVAIELLVQDVVNAKRKERKADTSVLEAKIDQLVYQLYGLTEEEIAIVEKAVNE